MFGKSCSLIGAVHLPPLPGAAGYCGSVQEILDRVMGDVIAYKEEGFDGLIVENTHDTPYLKGRVYPETLAAMTAVAGEIKRAAGLPLGAQVLAGANLEALALAVALELDFIRVEGFVFAHVGDEGLHDACAPELIRKRFDLGAERVKVYADIKKKHASHAITSDIDLAESARAAEFFKADGVVVTGVRTGSAPFLEEAEEAKASVEIPVLIGSGVNPENLAGFASCSDALIIGSYAKVDGRWQNGVDRERCKLLMQAAAGTAAS